MSNSTLDGHQLVDFALTRERGKAPAIELNPLENQTDWNEQTGLAHLIKGLVGRYRNPTSHQTRLLRQAGRPILELMPPTVSGEPELPITATAFDQTGAITADFTLSDPDAP